MRIVSHERPPPCGNVCWEWVSEHGWRYTRSTKHCGHTYDPHQHIWRWQRRTEPTSEETTQ